ncbi:hypothetical protein CXB51_025737 [Gossypium anomalum]|uniref:Uncharacterized protein n=1 Tax=Gossypium anomalum TaxID=47600 RepID=A0A8J5Y242_9ROSI|nr:hypothetical protein CXB51_025737 [Gossypium anomalum]
MAANTNTLSLGSVLEKDKLNGLNFLDWFRNLRIVLKQERKLYVIEKPLPDEPPANASRADKDAYKKHLDEMVDVGCLIPATMNPELQKQHEDMVAYDMIEHLKELYQGQARQESLSNLGFPLTKSWPLMLFWQSLPDSYSQFVLNFNMNEIDKTLPQLLSMLRTAEGNMKKVGPKPILMVRNNKGKGKAKVPTKPKGKGGVSKEGNCFHCGVTGHWKRNCPVYLEEIKKASKRNVCFRDYNKRRTLARGDLDLQVGNEARVAVLAVGTFTYLCLVDLPEVDFTTSLLSPDDFSRYGYVYLMRHKSEALEKFKEFKNEVQNQLGKTIKTLRSDRGGEYLSLEFDDLLKECGIVSQLTPPGTPQWNGVSERRNRTLLDMVRSMMSHADLPTFFWGHALETTIFTLNCVPSKSVQRCYMRCRLGETS